MLGPKRVSPCLPCQMFFTFPPATPIGAPFCLATSAVVHAFFSDYQIIKAFSRLPFPKRKSKPTHGSWPTFCGAPQPSAGFCNPHRIASSGFHFQDKFLAIALRLFQSLLEASQLRLPVAFFLCVVLHQLLQF